MKFLLDTSFLMIPGKHGVDIFEGLREFGQPELYTLSRVIDELEKHVAEGSGKEKKTAKLALAFIERFNIKIIVTNKKEKNTDDSLFKRGNKFIVCTQDRELAERVREYGGKVVFLRQKKYLAMD